MPEYNLANLRENFPDEDEMYTLQVGVFVPIRPTPVIVPVI